MGALPIALKKTTTAAAARSRVITNMRHVIVSLSVSNFLSNFMTVMRRRLATF